MKGYSLNYTPTRKRLFPRGTERSGLFIAQLRGKYSLVKVENVAGKQRDSVYKVMNIARVSIATATHNRTSLVTTFGCTMYIIDVSIY